MALTELGFKTDIRLLQVNYYLYSNWTTAAGGPPPRPSFEDMIEKSEPHGRRWREEILPEVQELTNYFLYQDFDALSEAGLVDELKKLQETRVRAGQLHTLTMRPWSQIMELFVDTYQELTGKDDLSATRLLQGYDNKSVEAGTALWKLSRLVASNPSVRTEIDHLSEATAEEVLAALRDQPEAKAFIDALDSFLQEFGWRTDLLGLASPTWVEDPTIPLKQLQKYLELDDYDPEAERRRLASERDSAIKETMEGLDEQARLKLQTILDIAHDVNPVLADHNYYIDQRLTTAPRRLILAAGRRLVSIGSLDSPEDVFFLQLDELHSALLGESLDLKKSVLRRKQEMENWSRETPLASIGAEPPSDDPRRNDRMRGGHNFEADQPGLLLGNGASAGIVQGTARIFRTLKDVDRLNKGDVLVACTTMPPWTPLFAIASAIVVETGGILSHPAITAREYGLPAVLRVKDATTIIRDGQLLEVDGNKGRVRIIS